VNLKKELCGIVVLMSVSYSAISQVDEIPANNGSIKITPLVHSSLQIEYNQLVIQVDPWGIVDLSDALPADIILITDDIGHHLDKDAISKLRKSETVILMPASGKPHIPDGEILANGEKTEIFGISIESIPAYDIIEGPPAHPKGDANGYLITLGGKRLYLAGVTECVPELLELGRIDVAFMPMNIPPGRMTPAASAACTKLLNPDVVYLYHYDQGYTARVARSTSPAPVLPGGISIKESLELFEKELQGSGIDFYDRNWYPMPN